MDQSLIMYVTSGKGRIRFCPIIPLIFAAFIIFPAMASDTWQPVEARSWALIDAPPGWTSLSENNETTSPDSAVITAYSPDKKTRLRYILEHNHDEMTIEQIRKYQSSYMSQLGYRICQTKDPIIEENGDQTSFRQVYVRGTSDAAVIGTMVYPGWGQAHYALVMEGPDAVSQFYESIPPLMQEHIRPVTVEEKTE